MWWLLLACDGPGGTCAENTTDTCPTSNGDCLVIDGSRIEPPGVNDEETCWEVVSSSSVACSGWDVCDWKTYFAADPADGACWYFPQGCAPVGWGACEDKSVTVCG